MRNDWFRELQDCDWLKDDSIGGEEAEFIVKALCLKPDEDVLDAPCGAGRIAAHIARVGCNVFGIDINPRFIARAKERFASEGLNADFALTDMRATNFHDRFDAIYNWSGSFGYFSDLENLEVLQRLAIALKPGGRLLVDQPNRERLLRRFIHESQLETSVRRNHWNSADQRVESARFSGGEEEPMTFSSVRLYTLAQFNQLLVAANLSLETVYGDLDFSTYSRTSKRTIVVAKRAD